MKNKFKILILLITFIYSVANFAREGEPPLSINFDRNLKNTMDIYKLKPVDVDSLLKQYKVNYSKPLKFAIPNTTKITTESSGKWTDVKGGRIWNLRFLSEGATDINFGFTQFHLPEGAKLYFITSVNDKVFYDGPYTSEDNKPHKEFWSAPVPTGDVYLELFIPDGENQDLLFELSQVSTGFRDVFKLYGGYGLSLKQGACNVDVVCEEASEWSREIKSVAAYSIRGADTCTGTMIMNQEANYDPLFLTAAHCNVDGDNDQTIVTFWNYESPVCGQLSGGNRFDSLHGASLGPHDNTVDYTLLLLDDVPPPEYGVYWAGWDVSGDIPQGSVGIHHPHVDEKAISFNNDALFTGTSCINPSADNASHWIVNNWELGTTEPGSSGSGLWDPETHLLVGTLSGGQASCENPQGLDCYGKISEAWRRSQGNFSFRTVLDPNGTGISTINGAYKFRDCVIQFIEYVLDNGFKNEKQSDNMQRDLYKLRDNFLYKTSRGKIWAHNYYHFSPQLADIITDKDYEMAYDLFNILNKFYPAITRIIDYDNTIDSELFYLEDYKNLTSVLYRMKKYGDSELQAFIDNEILKFDFKSYVGGKMDYLAQDFLKYVLYK